jgi:decaprenylphospho-beta-D-erythro-pentofuranosid-2-ulose 2-reductase
MTDGLGNPQSVLVLGGGSDIAAATLRRLVARRTRRIVLAARRTDSLSALRAELEAAGAKVDAVVFDADDTDSHPQAIADAFDRSGPFDMVLVAFGLLGEPETSAEHHDQAVAVVRTNMLGAVSAMVPAAARLRAQGHGWLVVLSSLGAERPRASNAVYAAAKAGLDGFATALGDRLTGSGVRVMVVRPGFVHTKMTAGRPVLPMAASADDVAAGIVDGLRRGAETVWVPRRGRWAMLAARALPRAAFRRMAP